MDTAADHEFSVYGGDEAVSNIDHPMTACIYN